MVPATPPVVGIGWSGQVERTRLMASFSGGVTHRLYLAFTVVCRATYSQRNALFFGSHEAASESDFAEFEGPSTASRFSSSFAKS